MLVFHNLLQWFSHNPLGAATVVYITSVCGVLVYGYFEPRDPR
ncbi:MAG: hypothetical protein RI101_05130 [Nitrospira sp.]|jgi:cytochrome b|nr:hypothetical protein [Nitrospira sp.]